MPTPTEETLAKYLAEWKAQINASGQRMVREWIGKTPDSVPPDHVRARILMTWAKTCHLSGVKIRNKPWHIEHKHPLHLCIGVNGNRESNMRPALTVAHKEKSAEEQRAKGKADRRAARDSGLKKSKTPIPQPPKAPKPTTKLDQIRALGAGEIARRFK